MIGLDVLSKIMGGPEVVVTPKVGTTFELSLITFSSSWLLSNPIISVTSVVELELAEFIQY